MRKASSYETRLISVVSRTDERTVAKALRGERVRPMCLARIEEALASLGLSELLPSAGQTWAHR